jgi:hypothetical protein
MEAPIDDVLDSVMPKSNYQFTCSVEVRDIKLVQEEIEYV